MSLPSPMTLCCFGRVTKTDSSISFDIDDDSDENVCLVEIFAAMPDFLNSHGNFIRYGI